MKIDKKKLFKSGAPKSEQVTVPGLDEPLTVRGLSAAQRGALFGKCFDAKGKAKKGIYFAGELVAICVVDDEGARVFEDADLEELGNMHSDFIDPLFEAAQRLSGLATGAEDEATKN